MSRNIRNIISLLRKEILSSWGKKCKDFCFGCPVCWAHQTLENLESMYEDEDIWDMKKPVRKNKKI